MTDTQLYLAIGLPRLTVLTSLSVSLLQISAIRDELKEIRAEIRGLCAELRAEITGQAH